MILDLRGPGKLPHARRSWQMPGLMGSEHPKGGVGTWLTFFASEAAYAEGPTGVGLLADQPPSERVPSLAKLIVADGESACSAASRACTAACESGSNQHSCDQQCQSAS